MDLNGVIVSERGGRYKITYKKLTHDNDDDDDDDDLDYLENGDGEIMQGDFSYVLG